MTMESFPRGTGKGATGARSEGGDVKGEGVTSKSRSDANKRRDKDAPKSTKKRLPDDDDVLLVPAATVCWPSWQHDGANSSFKEKHVFSLETNCVATEACSHVSENSRSDPSGATMRVSGLMMLPDGQKSHANSCV